MTTLSNSLDLLGKEFIAIAGDVTNLDDLENTFKQTAEKFGKIDILMVC